LGILRILSYNEIVLRYVASLVLLIIFSLPATGKEMLVSVDPTRGPSASQPGFSFEKNPGPSLSDTLKLDLRQLIEYNQYFPSYWNEYANKPEVLYVTKYRGLHGLIYRHATRAITKYYNDALANT